MCQGLCYTLVIPFLNLDLDVDLFFRLLPSEGGSDGLHRRRKEGKLSTLQMEGEEAIVHRPDCQLLVISYSPFIFLS